MAEEQNLIVPEGPTCKSPDEDGRICGLPAVSADMPYCFLHVKEVGEDGKTLRYFDLVPHELKEEFKKHLEGGQKDLGGEIAIFRTMLSFLLQRLEKKRTDAGELVISREDTEQIREFGALIKSAVESQAKVNPDRVITLADMKKIIADIIRIIGSNLPPGDVRNRLVGDIQRYCMADLISRAIELPPGGGLSKSIRKE